jgi:hypothetical protein
MTIIRSKLPLYLLSLHVPRQRSNTPYLGRGYLACKPLMLAVRLASFECSCQREARWHLYKPKQLMNIIIGHQHGLKKLAEISPGDKDKGDSYAQ